MNITKIAVLSLALALSANAQTALTMTTTTAAMTATSTVLPLTSATGVNNRYYAYVYDYGAPVGELMRITSIVNTPSMTVQRTGGTGHASGAVVLVGPAEAFYTYNPSGTCTAANTQYTPWVNTQTGQQWLCSTVTSTWVPGWGNSASTLGVTAAVASAAGAITPSGPFFHITGTSAITGFTLPVGFHGGQFSAVFDGAATWTAAGNISNASLEAMTAGCRVVFLYDNNAVKWYPSTLTCNPTP